MAKNLEEGKQTPFLKLHRLEQEQIIQKLESHLFRQK